MGTRTPGCTENRACAMEQWLAELGVGPRNQPGWWQNPALQIHRAQTSGEKVEAAVTPKAAPGWLKLFLVWKPRPLSTQAQPSLAQGAAWPGDCMSQPSQNPAKPPPLPPPPQGGQSPLTDITFLKVLLWLVLLGLFVELEFGLAYFVLSLFYWRHVGETRP